MSGRRRERVQQRELPRRQLDRRPVPAHRPRHRVDDERAEPHPLPRAAQRRVAAAQQRLELRDEHDERERLDQVAVGAEVEPVGLVDLAVLRREQQHRRVDARGAQPLQHPVAGQARQDDVEHDGVEAAGEGGAAARTWPSPTATTSMPSAAEPAGHERRADARLVVDHQHACHTRTLPRRDESALRSHGRSSARHDGTDVAMDRTQAGAHRSGHRGRGRRRAGAARAPGRCGRAARSCRRSSPEDLVSSVLKARPGPFDGTVELDNDARAARAAADLPQAANGTSTARVWSGGDGKGRVADPEPDSGERTLVSDGTTLWAWNSDDRTVTKRTRQADQTRTAAPPTRPDGRHRRGLAALRATSTVSRRRHRRGRRAAPPTSWCWPRSPTERTLLREVRVAVDAEKRMPLRLTVLAGLDAARAAGRLHRPHVRPAGPGAVHVHPAARRDGHGRARAATAARSSRATSRRSSATAGNRVIVAKVPRTRRRRRPGPTPRPRRRSARRSAGRGAADG